VLVANAADENNNLPAVASAYREMNVALASEESLASNENVRLAIYGLETDANDIAYEMGSDQVTLAEGYLPKFRTDENSLQSACSF
jgi:hypothetical protein